MGKSIFIRTTAIFGALAGLFFLSLAVSCKKSESVLQPAKNSKYGKLQTADIAVPASGLIAYWSLDNTGNDLSGNYNNGAVNNVTSVADRFGKPNGAYHFNGVNSNIAVPDNEALRLANTDFTINAWVKLDSYDPSYGCEIVGKRTVGVSNSGYLFGIEGNVRTQGVLNYNSGSGIAAGVTPVSLNQWHMVTTTYSVLNEVASIYIDGVLDQTINNVVTPSSTSNAVLYIGSDDPSGLDDGYYFQGSLDDISIYNSALSYSSITQLYKTTSTDATPGLIAYWPFNNTGDDLSGNNNNGTVYNVSSVADRFGNSIGAYHFEDSTSYVSVADNQPLRLHNTDFTVNEWVNLDYYNPGAASMLLSKYSSKGTGWLWAIAGNLESPFAGIGDFNTGYGKQNSYTNNRISANSWHMLTAVYTVSQQTMNVFIDGQLNHTITNIPTPDSTASAPLFIGRLNPSLPGNGYYFAGSMDEVSIYNSAISASTINQLYTATH